MKTYVIDAYNLLYALPEMPVGTLEEKRLALLRFLKERQLQGRDQLRLVFDNRQGGGSRQTWEEFEIVFTSGESADEWIIEHVRDHPAKTLVVVTNDQDLRRLIRGTGAQWVSADDFLKRDSAPPSRRAPHDPEIFREITNELKGKWL